MLTLQVNKNHFLMLIAPIPQSIFIPIKLEKLPRKGGKLSRKGEKRKQFKLKNRL
jgi:hypothetical protein